MDEFKKTKTFEQRKAETDKMLAKYPNRACIFLSKTTSCDLPTIDKQKFLCPVDLTVGQLLHVIRKRIKMDSSKAIFLFTNKEMSPPTTLPVGLLYKEEADTDGYLYLNYNTEATFG